MPSSSRAKRPARKKSARPVRKQPEPLRLRTVAPSLTVNDLPRSLRWYRDVLGFKVSQEWKSGGKVMGAAVRAGTVEFWLGQDDFAKGRDRAKGEGFRLYCTTAQDIDQLADVIKARGGVLEQEPADQPWGARDFTVLDPDGFKITITTSL